MPLYICDKLDNKCDYPTARPPLWAATQFRSGTPRQSGTARRAVPSREPEDGEPAWRGTCQAALGPKGKEPTMKVAKCDIGLIGMGVMVKSLVLNLVDHGFRVAVYNRTVKR